MIKYKPPHYELNIYNRKTNILLRTLIYTNVNTAREQLNFYNSTINLKATLSGPFRS